MCISTHKGDDMSTAERYTSLVVRLATISERGLTGSELADGAIADREDALRAQAISLAAIVNGADVSEAEDYLDADIEDELANRRYQRIERDDTPSIDDFAHRYEMAV